METTHPPFSDSIYVSCKIKMLKMSIRKWATPLSVIIRAPPFSHLQPHPDHDAYQHKMSTDDEFI